MTPTGSNRKNVPTTKVVNVVLDEWRLQVSKTSKRTSGRSSKKSQRSEVQLWDFLNPKVPTPTTANEMSPSKDNDDSPIKLDHEHYSTYQVQKSSNLGTEMVGQISPINSRKPSRQISWGEIPLIQNEEVEDNKSDLDTYLMLDALPKFNSNQPSSTNHQTKSSHHK